MVNSPAMKSISRRAVFEALFAVIIWGASFVVTKVALRHVSPNALVWLRFGIGLVILGIAVVTGRKFALPARRDWMYLALLGLVGISFHQWLQSTGLLTSMATTTGWIIATIPIFMAILGWVVLKERLSWLQVGGILLSTFGVLLVVTRGKLDLLVSGKLGTIGDLMVLISAPNWAIFSVLSRSGLQRYPAVLMMFYVMGFGWCFTSLLFLAEGGFHQIQQLPLEGWLGIGFLGVFSSGLAYIAWYDALQILPVAKTGAFLYLEPIITMIVAGSVLGEKLTLAVGLGGGMILLGVGLVNLNKMGRVQQQSNGDDPSPG